MHRAASRTRRSGSACGSRVCRVDSLRICEIDDFSAPVGLFGLTPSGAVDTRVGPDGFRQLASGGCIGFTSDASGRLYWVSRRWLGDGRAAIEVRRTTHTGILDAAWGQGGSATIELSRGHLKPVTAVPAPDGSLLIGVAISDAANNAGWHGGVARLKPDGTVDASVRDGWHPSLRPAGDQRLGFLALTVDSSGRPVVSVDVPTGRPYPGPSTTGYLLRARASDGCPTRRSAVVAGVTLSRPLVGLAMAGPSRILGTTAVRDGLVLSALGELRARPALVPAQHQATTDTELRGRLCRCQRRTTEEPALRRRLVLVGTQGLSERRVTHGRDGAARRSGAPPVSSTDTLVARAELGPRPLRATVATTRNALAARPPSASAPREVPAR